MNSLGFIEVSSVTGAVDALDIMCKTADVQFVTWERKLGGRLVTIIVQGTVSAVQAAVDAVKADVDAFAGEAEQFDDITMLCLTWHGPQAEEVQA